MRTLEASAITRAVRDLCITINHRMGEDMLAALERARAIEESELGRSVLDRLLENARVARERWFPICQDTGSAVVFADVGQDLHVSGGDVEGAIIEGVRLGYRDGYLRASIVRGPIDRTNTQDNTPAIVYYRIVPGDRLDLAMLAKGAGCRAYCAIPTMPRAGTSSPLMIPTRARCRWSAWSQSSPRRPAPWRMPVPRSARTIARSTAAGWGWMMTISRTWPGKGSSDVSIGAFGVRAPVRPARRRRSSGDAHLQG